MSRQTILAADFDSLPRLDRIFILNRRPAVIDLISRIRSGEEKASCMVALLKDNRKNKDTEFCRNDVYASISINYDYYSEDIRLHPFGFSEFDSNSLSRELLLEIGEVIQTINTIVTKHCIDRLQGALITWQQKYFPNDANENEKRRILYDVFNSKIEPINTFKWNLMGHLHDSMKDVFISYNHPDKWEIVDKAEEELNKIYETDKKLEEPDVKNCLKK